MLTKNEAIKYLSDVPSEQCFWVNNGPILKNMDELASTLPELNDEIFRYHVNNEKNDFSSWIKNSIGDQKLANELLSSKNKDSFLKKIKNRLNSLKKKAG